MGTGGVSNSFTDFWDPTSHTESPYLTLINGRYKHLLLQLDIPRFNDACGRPALFWLEKEEGEVGAGRGNGEEGLGGRRGAEAAAGE